MNQLGFDSAPILETPFDFLAPTPDERIADIEVVRRLHRRDFKPMDANSKAPGKVVVYHILPAVLPPLPTPASRQGMAPAPDVKMMSPAQKQARILEAKAINALTLDGRNVVRPY